MARTLRGFVSLERSDAAGAEADARAVLAVVEPHGVLEPAQVGPKVLLGLALQAQGQLDAALVLLRDAASAPDAPALLFSRRQAVACYAAALVAAGSRDEALHWAERAVTVTGDDVRSRVYASRVLAMALFANGQVERARQIAEDAVRDAHATQQVSERGAASAVLDSLG
jgi:tetratricopeptide (TPR) repeat protein